MSTRLMARSAVTAAALSLLLVGTQVGGTVAHAAKPTGACVLTGTARFSPGLKLTPQSVTYTFSGALSNCEGKKTNVASASISASGGGTLLCGGGTSAGQARVVWNTGQVSVVSFQTTSATAATAIAGSVTSGLFDGESAAGSIVFETTTPQQCKNGLPTLTFTGTIAIG
jgi:hypothetical protein